jgi:hypothetical protein
MERIGVIETYLSTCIVFVLIWLWQDFLGIWLSVVIGSVSIAVLAIATVSEWIEPSRVPRRYFWLMGAVIFGILSAALMYKLVLSA